MSNAVLLDFAIERLYYLVVEIFGVAGESHERQCEPLLLPAFELIDVNLGTPGRNGFWQVLEADGFMPVRREILVADIGHIFPCSTYNFYLFSHETRKQ
ncbi:MAG: hypothetical protein NTV46_01785 [Verrucomicrobia bacterium]|nr:hypothetical protein [Verrucomicrobiota bacterium]